MQESFKRSQPSPLRVSWRAVALPADHGGWGFLLEPLLLGILVAPTLRAAVLAITVAAAFLLRQPVKVIVADWQRGRSYTRTLWAWRFALLYTVLVITGIVTVSLMAGVEWMVPSLIALPVGIVFLYFDFLQPGRSWQAEVSAPLALASAAASIGILDGWSLGPSLALWAVLVMRAIPAVLYVRTRLRLDRGNRVETWIPVVAYLIGLLVVITLVIVDLLPPIAILPFALLLIRTAHGLSPWRWRASVKAIGVSELTVGIVCVILVAAGY